MRAWLLKSFDGIQNMELVDDAPEPKATGGDAVVRMRYAALNPADRYLAEGQYPAHPPLPHVLGRDGVGTISGNQLRMVLRGEVGVSRWGTLAERVAVPETDLLEVPAGWSLEESAGAALVYLTAYQALVQWSELDLIGKNILVTGASGGVGVACVQLGKALGARILAMSRSEEKGRRLRELGADEILNPEDEQWVERVKKKLDLRIDLAIDNIGGPLFSRILEVMNHHGRISCVGRLAGPVPEFNTAAIFFRRIRIGGVAVGAYGREEAHAAWDQIVALLARSGARPIIDSIWDFEKVPEAFARLKQGPMGKVLIRLR